MVVTNKAVAELIQWAQKAQCGQGEPARAHLQSFYHIASGLLGTTEFQQAWSARTQDQLEPGSLEIACKLLDTIAAVETEQVERHGIAK